MTDAQSLSPEPAFARELLTDMIRVRRMEEKCAEMYSAGKIRGFLHLYVGEEAVAAGSLRVLGADDAVIATYREHAHALLRIRVRMRCGCAPACAADALTRCRQTR